MTLLAVRGANSYAHAYGIVTAADITGFVAPSWPQITNDAQMASIHLLLQIKQTDGGSGQEISFDEADVRGMFHVPGHPGVLGIWLASSTVAGAVTDPIMQQFLA